MPDLTITIVQADLAWEDIEANLAMFAERIAAIDRPTDLIVLPEMFSTGFSMTPAGLAETMDGHAVAWLQQTARQHAVDIAGSLMIEENGRYYNRLVWARPDGSTVTYDKKHLFRYAGEEKVYTPGDSLVTVELNGWRVRPFICYDLRFPVWTRNFDKTYDLAVFVANWPAKRAAHWRALLPARAIENQAFVAGVNRVGKDGNGYPHSGDSAVIAPTGEVIFEQRDQACVRTVTLSRQVLEDYRRQFPAWMDADAPLASLPQG